MYYLSKKLEEPLDLLVHPEEFNFVPAAVFPLPKVDETPEVLGFDCVLFGMLSDFPLFAADEPT